MKTALLLIDIQNEYFDKGAMPLVGSIEACENAKALLDHFRVNGLPIVHIQHHAIDAVGSFFFLPHTRGVEIHKNVKPIAHEIVVAKNYPNSFRETTLFNCLGSMCITDLVICGMMTHMCVDATTRAAKDLGFNCTVIGDACATMDLKINGQHVKASDVHLSFLAALNGFYAVVKTTKQYLKIR